MSPDGETLNQKMANTMSMYENIIILCGHYVKGGPARSRSFHYERNLYWRLCIIRGELGALVLSDALTIDSRCFER
jgi:tRNA (guanine37-N1)-methyltransferase